MLETNKNPLCFLTHFSLSGMPFEVILKDFTNFYFYFVLGRFLTMFVFHIVVCVSAHVFMSSTDCAPAVLYCVLFGPSFCYIGYGF